MHRVSNQREKMALLRTQFVKPNRKQNVYIYIYIFVLYIYCRGDVRCVRWGQCCKQEGEWKWNRAISQRREQWNGMECVHVCVCIYHF